MPKLARQQLARQWTAIQEEERQRDAASGKISTTEALEILEIEAVPPEQEIRAAYKRLMKRNPDVGWSEYFSKQLNAAREVPLRQWAQ
jgi:hypothetical protein